MKVGFKKAAAAVIILFAFSVFAVSCGPFSAQSPPTPAHLISESEKEATPIRPIAEREERLVTGGTFYERQLSLSETVAGGFKPKFDESGSDVKEVYDAAVAVLDGYVLNDFGDFDRVHAVHDWLCDKVRYDTSLYNRYLAGEQISKEHDSFNLAGVFLYGKAVCDGIAKAFTLLCNIEGIDCVPLYGEYGGAAHVWNKVKVNGYWYNADATLDSADIDFGGRSQTQLTHGFFLLSDSAFESSPFGSHKVLDPNLFPNANPLNIATPSESYPVYENLKIDIAGKSFDALVTSSDALGNLFAAVKSAKRKVGKLDIKLRLDGVNPERIGAFDYYLKKALQNVKNTDFRFDAQAGIRPYSQYPEGVLLLLIYV